MWWVQENWWLSWVEGNEGNDPKGIINLQILMILGITP
jgi:hypothetical protein